MKTVLIGLGGPVTGQKIEVGEDEIESIHDPTVRLELESGVDNENGDEQVDGVVAVVEIGDRQAGQNEVHTFEVDVRFDEKHLVDQTDRVG